MQVTRTFQLIPGLWGVGGDTGTVSALGTIRRTGNGFAFRGPGTADGNAARRELLEKAGIEPHLWERDGFASIEAAVAYLNEKLAA